ncbi:hypothetical protein [Seonamhaeicola sp.]|uniref:hypothetical protein n=1 Tax=Seonamhaeicola sp. TaxID=1912245 RepID=UPI00261A5D2E|nr:hypothetical protein [Seonamhaeicola sp.]
MKCNKIICWAFLLLVISGYGQGKKVQPIEVKKGKLLFSDDFETGTLERHWEVRERFKNGAYAVENGHLKGKQLKGVNHGSVMRVKFDYSDIIVEFDVKFNGGERFNIVMDDSTNTTSYWGHIQRVSFSKNGFRIKDDKTGGMDLKIREEIKNNPKRAEELKPFLDSKSVNTKFNFKEGQWYHVKIIKKGAILQCQVGDVIGRLKSEGIAHPVLNKFGPTVVGDHFLFDNFKMWQIK